MSIRTVFLLPFFVITILMGSCGKMPIADLVLINGKIATVDKDFSIKESVAVKGGNIVFVGSNDNISSYIGPDTKVIDLKGKLTLPGLIDAHAHIHNLGEKLINLNISHAESYQQLVDIVAERVKMSTPGEWIIGGRWDQTKWKVKNFPEHDLLSRVSKDNPVFLRRVDGNSAFVNKKALEIAGITRDTPEPFGGAVIRKKNGEPTGVLINRAMNLVKKHFPPESDERYRKKVIAGLNSCLTVGLTGVHEAGIGPHEIEQYKRLIDDDMIHVRVYAMLGEQETPVLDVEDLTEYFRQHRIDNYGNHGLSVRSIKLFFDGALGSRGAAFFQPYADDPDNTGLLRISPEYVTKVSMAALEAGMGVNTHCIGIRGNRLCLAVVSGYRIGHPVWVRLPGGIEQSHVGNIRSHHPPGYPG